MACSEYAIKHHHAHHLAGLDRLLLMAEHDQSIGVSHGTENARALIAGGPDLQLPLVIEANPPSLIFGAARSFADGL